jgi:transposase InsO family protein
MLTAAARVQRRNKVFDELRKARPSVKLLYTTPEQLAASAGLVDRLGDLHARRAFVGCFVRTCKVLGVRVTLQQLAGSAGLVNRLGDLHARSTLASLLLTIA